MTENNKRFGCAMLCAFISGAAFAASEDYFELAPEQLSKIKVTAASAFTESELDSSASVSVVTRDDWERRAARNLPDAVMHLPGVMLLAPPGGGLLIQVRSYDSASLRGRATLVDGVPINTFAFGSEVYSNAEMQLGVMDSLELVRGPSSVLYGSDAFHSAMVLSTYHEPENNFEVDGEAASRNYQRVSVRGTQKITGDQTFQLAISAAHQGNQGDEYTYPSGSGTATASRERSYQSGTGMLRWSGRGEAVGYQLELFTDQTNANQYPSFGTLVINDLLDHDLADRYSHLWMLKGDLNGELGMGWSWQWSNYYWRNSYGQNYFLLLPVVGFSDEDQQFVEHRYATSLSVKRAGISAFNALTQVALTVGNERQAIDDHKVTSLVSSVLPTIPTPDYTGLEQSINNLSVEGKTQWEKGRYQLIYGGRVDNYSSFGSQTSPRVGAIWMPVTNYSVKALYGQAFRAPNANELRGTNFVTGDPDIKPETLDNYELVFTHAFNSGVFQVTGFQTRWHDRIVNVNQHYTNGGESESKGVEFSAKFDRDQWRFELSGARITNHTIDSPLSACGCEPDVFPKWMADVGIGYRWPRHETELFWTNRVHSDVRTGDDTVHGNVTDAGMYYRSDISLRQQWSNLWQTQIAMRNIFDRDNVWPSVVNANGGSADIPRQISFEITYRGLQ